jgi:hypothetical protein
MPFDQYDSDGRAIPTVVLNGLDNISARHQVHRALWPDIVIDGAIGDFTCQVSRHPWPDNVACLMCLLREPPGPPTLFKCTRPGSPPNASRARTPSSPHRMWRTRPATSRVFSVPGLAVRFALSFRRESRLKSP